MRGFKNDLKTHEALVKAATIILWFVGLVYVFRANELMKTTASGVDRLLVALIMLFGVMRLSQEIPLAVYRWLKGRRRPN